MYFVLPKAKTVSILLSTACLTGFLVTVSSQAIADESNPVNIITGFLGAVQNMQQSNGNQASGDTRQSTTKKQAPTSKKKHPKSASSVEDFSSLQEKAEKDDASAQRELARRYYLGKDGAPLDYDKAAEWARKSADQGDAAAQSMLAVMYIAGRGVPQDDDEALKWFSKGKKLGDAQAQIGALYYFGEESLGIPKNHDKAAKWIKSAAEQGNAPAEQLLGAIYAIGDGVPESLIKSYFWSSLSANAGNKDAIKLRDSEAHEVTPAQLSIVQKALQDWKAGSPEPALTENDNAASAQSGDKDEQIKSAASFPKCDSEFGTASVKETLEKNTDVQLFEIDDAQDISNGTLAQVANNLSEQKKSSETCSGTAVTNKGEFQIVYEFKRLKDGTIYTSVYDRAQYQQHVQEKTIDFLNNGGMCKKYPNSPACR